MSDHEATELVATGFEFMALSSGYLNPEAGLALLRSELGLNASG
jgi:hypothetical protein